MAESMRALIFLISILLIQSCSEYQECKYTPVVFEDGERLVEKPGLISKIHLDDVSKVLDFYNIEYSRINDLELNIKGDVCGDRDLIWNMTTKAGDSNWFELQGLK
jgi:hypothetical protein